MESIRWGLHCIPWGNISPTFGRISVCITFLYLTQIDRSTMRWPLWLFIVLQAIFNIAYVVAFYYQASAWLSPEFNPLAPNARWNTEVQLAMGYFVGAFNCLTDAFLTVWPAMLISRSRLALRKRIGLGFLLCMSVVALVAAIAKTHSVKSLNEPSDYTCMSRCHLLAQEKHANKSRHTGNVCYMAFSRAQRSDNSRLDTSISRTLQKTAANTRTRKQE